MKILIVGAKGMLGQELSREFLDGNEVLTWDREEIDITNFEGTARLVKDARPDFLVNAAAYNDVDGAEENHELADRLNGYAVGNMAKICKENSITMVHFSTDYVFDGENQIGYVEADSPGPLSAYARSKFLGEQELQRNTDKYYLIRLSRLFGKPASSAVGKKSFIELMLTLAEKQKVLDVVDEEFSCQTYAPDLAEKVKQIVDFRQPYGIYHCTNEGGATWYGFAQEIFKITGKNAKLNPVPSSRYARKAMRPKFSVLLNTKLEKVRPWQEALREFLISN